MRTTIAAGNQASIGAPTTPMPAELVRRISKLLLNLGTVREAYVPQCYIPGHVDPPAQILVVVLDGRVDVERAVEEIGAGLVGLLPEGQHLDVIPQDPKGQLLADVRRAGCEIPCRERSWWQFWVRSSNNRLQRAGEE